MGVFKKRYFALISLIFLGFSWFSFLGAGFEIFTIFALPCLILSYFLKKKGKMSKNLSTLLCLALAISLVACLNAYREQYAAANVAEKYGGVHRIEGYVKQMPSKTAFSSEHAVHIESVDGESADFDCVLVAEYATELIRGDFFSVVATLCPLGDYENADYLHNSDEYEYPLVAAVGEYAEIEYLEPEFRFDLMLSGLNARLSGLLKHHIGGESGELASALLLGNRMLLRDETIRDFRLAGVYHMLALSGQHVAILVAVFEFLLGKLRVGKRARVIILGALTLFYIALTGFLPSACRAMLMLWVLYISFLFGKRSDSMTSLFAAVFIIALVRPSAVLDIGFQLSFLSTFGVICAMMMKERIFFFQGEISGGELYVKFAKLGRSLAQLLLISVCVFVATLPALMIYFGEFSLATFVSNLFMGALCEIFMILSLITLALTRVPWLCAIFGDIAQAVGELMTEIIGGIADFDGVLISLRYPFAPVLVFGLFISATVLVSVELRNRRWLYIVPMCFALVFGLNAFAYNIYRSDFTRAEFVLGDAFVISSAEGVYICDASNGRSGAIFDGVALAKENCHTKIDGAVLTHYHSYHIRTLEKLANTQKLESVLLPRPMTEKEASVMSSIYRALEGKGVDIIIYEPNTEILLLGGSLTVSERAYTNGYAHPSVAISYSYGENRITVVERPYFGTYLEEKGDFAPLIKSSDVLIFGADGRTPKESFEIFSGLDDSTEVYFTDFELMELSDFEKYLNTRRIFFDVWYKKYDLR